MQNLKQIDKKEHKESLEIFKNMLRVVNDCLNKFLKGEKVEVEDLQQFGKEITPYLKKSAIIAAEIQMEALVNYLYQLKMELGPEEWRKLHALIPTVWPVSKDNPRELALRWVMDPATVDTNLVIAEGVKTVEDALVTLARTKDRAIAHLVFGKGDNETRSMICAYSSPRDLLTDVAEISLKKLEEEGRIPQRVRDPQNRDKFKLSPYLISNGCKRFYSRPLYLKNCRQFRYRRQYKRSIKKHNLDGYLKEEFNDEIKTPNY